MGALALYVLISYGLLYRARVRRGSGLVGYATSGVVRVVAVGLTAVVGVAGRAYHDHRAETRSPATDR